MPWCLQLIVKLLYFIWYKEITVTLGVLLK